MIPVALIFARRELRGGLKGFRILVACLMLGVAAIAAAGSLKAAFHAALEADARELLGGDIEVRQSHRPMDSAQHAALSELGRTASVMTLRAMAVTEDGRARRLVEMKAIGPGYPLVGAVTTAPTVPLHEVLAKRGDAWGAIAAQALLDHLGLSLGDRLRVGDTVLEIRSVLVDEPDRLSTGLAFGPRLMIGEGAVQESGLILPGSMIQYATRVVLSPGISLPQARHRLAQAVPQAGWEVRDSREAGPAMGRVMDNLTSFLTLVGLTSLLVGGIGIANAVKAYLDGRIATIATLKCLGASPRVIGLTYGVLVAALAGVGIVLGLALGAASVPMLVAWGRDLLPTAIRSGVYPLPLVLALACGALTTMVFTVWPLARARAIPATVLFRGAVDLAGWRPGWRGWSLLVLAVAALVACAVGTAERPAMAGGFVAASLVTLLLFRAVAQALSFGAARLSVRLGGVHPSLRLALSALHRPGSAVVSMVLSLGLGLTVLVAIAVVEGNLARQFGEVLPRRAPSFFFIDIQGDQREPFIAAVHGADRSAAIEQAPMVRGRITRINGRPVEDVAIGADAEWAVRGDRGLTSSVRPPEGNRVVAGDWWPETYQGTPLVSLDVKLAQGFGVGVGDSLTVNVLGRDITATIANLREIQWASLNLNFALILSPNALAGAPHSWIATVHGADGAESAVERAVTDRLPNVSSIRVKEAVESVRVVIGHADMAVRIVGLVTVASGALVLAGAVMAGHRRKVREAVILKVLGATPGDLWRAWLMEFGLIGVVTGMVATVVGNAAGWAILVLVLKTEWVALLGVSGGIVLSCVLAALGAGFAGTFGALRTKAAPFLREE